MRNSTTTEFAAFSGYLASDFEFPEPNIVVYNEHALVFYLEFVVPKLYFVAFNQDAALLKLEFEVP
ncbi:hypothetical protein [Flavobacterium kingsejongi]|uniref:hypothetical protein n=1 Tax=Flavobacterium kingsejongi TaxID=1678728 RepID=UPI0013004AD3|nr:hypothetical protein [Flavobacterium kingsejongi]